MSKISENIMKTHEFPDAVFYRIACDCGDPSCDICIELEKDEDMPYVDLNIYKTLYYIADNYSPFYKVLWRKIKAICSILFIGHIKIEEVFLMRESQINGFIQALEEGREHIQKEIEKEKNANTQCKNNI
jgi:hypothetical protein